MCFEWCQFFEIGIIQMELLGNSNITNWKTFQKAGKYVVERI